MTHPRRVVLRELDPVGEAARLSDAEAAWLAGTGLVAIRALGGGNWQLLPCGKVGAVRAGDLDVQVKPKTDIAQVLFLLCYASDPGFRPEDMSGAPGGDLWHVVGESLARLCERALAPGILQGYTTVDETLTLVRGRIRIGDQLARRPGLLLPLEVRYDDYVPDIAENQIMRSALRRMAAVPGLPGPIRGRLTYLDGRLDGVTVLPARAPVPEWRPSRINVRYVPALRLAEVVLRNQSAEAGPDDVTVAAFVVSMPRVFEDFVTAAISSALDEHPGETVAQYVSHLDVDKSIEIKPDVVHLRDGFPAAVFDAKYKLEDSTSGYPNADAYQMLSYCTALGLAQGWLVYAEGTTTGPRQILNTNVEIVHYSLDLTSSPANLLSQIQHLANCASSAR
jgi:5-methylcytosine-specific restriction enzyme subunit McrC